MVSMPGTGGAGAPVMRLRALHDTQELTLGRSHKPGSAESSATGSYISCPEYDGRGSILPSGMPDSTAGSGLESCWSSLSLPTHHLR